MRLPVSLFEILVRNFLKVEAEVEFVMDCMDQKRLSLLLRVLLPEILDLVFCATWQHFTLNKLFIDSLCVHIWQLVGAKGFIDGQSFQDCESFSLVNKTFQGWRSLIFVEFILVYLLQSV